MSKFKPPDGNYAHRNSQPHWPHLPLRHPCHSITKIPLPSHNHPGIVILIHSTSLRTRACEGSEPSSTPHIETRRLKSSHLPTTCTSANRANAPIKRRTVESTPAGWPQGGTLLASSGPCLSGASWAALLNIGDPPLQSGQTGRPIDIGRRSPAFPVTPPYIRIRIRRFGGLSYR